MLKVIGASLLALLILVPASLLLAGQFNFLTGQRPTDLGAGRGMLKAPDASKENSISSQAALHPHTDYHLIAPLAFKGDGKRVFSKLTAIVRAMDGARVIDAQPDYLYAQFQSKWLKFIDDVEFVLDDKDGVIHMRSASRLGQSDLGANRRRLEAVRTQLELQQ